MAAAPSRAPLRVLPLAVALVEASPPLPRPERRVLAAARRRDVAVTLASRARLAALAGPLRDRGAPAALVGALERAGRGGVPRRHAALPALIAAACVGETLLVADAAARLAGATDPGVRAVLAARVRRAGRAAGLAWDAAWWLVAGGEAADVVALAAAFRRRLARAEARPLAGPDIVSHALRARGVPPRGERAAVRHAAVVAVLRPAVGALARR